MKYKYLWVFAALLILADAGMTVWALDNGYVEDNPTMAEAMDEYGVLEAATFSVLIRFGTLGVGAGLQKVNGHNVTKAIPIAFLLPMSAYPVIHNLFVIFMW